MSPHATWPRDIPPPSHAPPGERDCRPAHRLHAESRATTLEGGLVAALQLAHGWRGAYRASWRVALLWAALYRRERDEAREEALRAQAHAAEALDALMGDCGPGPEAPAFDVDEALPGRGVWEM